MRLRAAIFCVAICFFGGPLCSASSNDAAQVIAVILKHPRLQEYYHANCEGRRPLVLSSKNLPDKIAVEVLGAPVRILSSEAITASAIKSYVEFSEFKIEGNQAQATLNYPIEGVRFKALLQRTTDEWVVERISLVER